MEMEVVAVVSDEHEGRSLPEFGSLVTGTVEAVFGWGIIVDIGLDSVGLIDVLYIAPDASYVVGDELTVYLDTYDTMKKKFILRPPDQVPLSERLKEWKRTSSE